MSVLSAYKKSVKKAAIPLGPGGYHFALLAWKNPNSEGSGLIGPLFITVIESKNMAIEVYPDGRFKDWFPTEAEGYVSYFETRKTDKQKIKDVIKLLTDKL